VSAAPWRLSVRRRSELDLTETDFGYPPGPRFPAVADGYWILVHPLRPGHHTIRIQAAAASIGFQLDVNYQLEVTGRR
jgi:hypothetical protein